MTVIFGLLDFALDYRLSVDGIERFFALPPPVGVSSGADLRSYVIRLKSCGHWSMMEDVGRDVLEKTLLFALDEDKGVGLRSPAKKSLKSSLQQWIIDDEVDVWASN